MTANERRMANLNMIRGGYDRRVYNDPSYKGPERRCGEERRTQKDRRKKM